MGFSLISEKKEQKNSFIIGDDQNKQVQHIQEVSDIAQTIKELNDDKLDRVGFSRIDMKSRLLDIEISAILCVDTLVSLSMLPAEVGFLTLKKERLSVSQNGKGRQEVVEIAKGIQQQNNGHSILDGIGNMFRGGSKQ
jgi:hypothetical protein